MKVCIACGTKFDGSGWQCPLCHFSPKSVCGCPSFINEIPDSGEFYRPEYFEQLYALEASSFWFRSRNSLINWALRRFFPEARSFFEIGCGTGFVLSGIESKFHNLSLYGSEIHEAGLFYASRRLRNAQLFQMDGRLIPFEDEFDVMGAFDVLEHVREDERVLMQICKAVAPGGGMILTVPQHPFLWSRLDDLACHVRRYCAGDLRARVRNAGFEIVRMTSFVSIIFPLMLLSRLFKNRPGRNFDPVAELKLGQPLDLVLEKALDLERALINCGLSFPAGGSLLLIARKPGSGRKTYIEDTF
ncbi:MAG TPA: class I SAM-dependent methyltransferase [Desulfobacteraceae bacterium]|nr:class I SAM-dependent methyltransferase [Desulfobacteraceae bacterium]HPJ67751.1 class I SAM-dependent methyltransferase [Desulfobacteraceae bacterium]HPQ28099.1 class I SAM-dependent methyltransferase [Desulfobacteraceae bacterium]